MCSIQICIKDKYSICFLSLNLYVNYIVDNKGLWILVLIDRGLNDKFTHSYPLFLAILVLSNIQLFPHLQNNVTKVFDDSFHLFFSCL